MVRAGDLRNVAKLLRPRDALEKLECVEHVGLDLPELLPGQAAPGDREDLGFLRRDDGVVVAQMIDEGADGDVVDSRRRVGGHDGGLVGRPHGREVRVDLPQELLQLEVPHGRLSFEALARAPEETTDFLSRVPELEAPLEDLRPLADQLEALRQELLGLDEHVLAHADFTEVVQERGIADLADLIGGEMQVAERSADRARGGLGDGHRQIGNPERVPGGGGVARLDGGDRSIDEALEEHAHAFVQPAVVERDRRLRGERGGEADEALGVGQHLALDLFGRGKALCPITLAVDQLEDPDDVARRRPHRHHQHGLGPVAGMPVEGRVDVIAGVARRLVGVGEVNALSCQRHVAGDALLVHRHVRGRGGAAARVRRGQGDRVVLGELKAKPPRLAVRLLNEVNGAGVAVGDGARQGEDEREQSVDIALRREPDADFVELLELAPRLFGLAAHPDEFERVRQRARENGPRDGLGQARVPVGGQRHAVRWRGHEGDRGDGAFAARGDDRLRWVTVRVQHEYGVFGGGERGRDARAHGAWEELRRQGGHEARRRRTFGKEHDTTLHESKGRVARGRLSRKRPLWLDPSSRAPID